MVAVIIVFFLVILANAVKVLREYERGVVFRLGRLLGEPKGPGLFLLIPIVDRMVKVDLRVVTLVIPPQEVITRDNVPVRVNAVAYFQTVDPSASIVKVADFGLATSQISQTTLRSVLGQHMLDELLSERDKINQILQRIIDEQTGPWGIKVNIVEVRDVEIPSGMQRAMARQAEAERERRAKVIAAEGEFQASAKLTEAAAVISEHPIALTLRYLQTLTEIAGTNNSTTIFPVPIDLLQPFLPTDGDRGAEGIALDLRTQPADRGDGAGRARPRLATRGHRPHHPRRRRRALPVLRGPRGDDATGDRRLRPAGRRAGRQPGLDRAGGAEQVPGLPRPRGGGARAPARDLAGRPALRR